ncbi:hypothetical protein GE061_018804 [Apolygus lucorum]|uniref:Guanylate kinase-like domain-containing protein n=1 Tax=Apolygus lucorum TaxID=248454 RepID=A0A6A4J8G5_APOLU|nr:hypothetical protein GE061_018804 [Apolygus lucorum]
MTKLCDKKYLVELDEDFRATGHKETDENTMRNILAGIGIPKTETIKPLDDDESTDSEEVDLSDRKIDVVQDPDCGYACEKDIGWFDIVQSAEPWNESRRPYDQILKYEDLTLTDEEKQGILSGMIVSTGLNFLDTVPLTDGHALTKLQLADRNLKDIQILDKYKYLQYLDLSHNFIEDLSPLEQSTYLITLDASYNHISIFKPNPTPWFLTYLNLSYNQFEIVPDISSMWSLKHLNLSNNKIKKIEGIQNLNYLQYLNMSHNHIAVIENISHVPLKTLDLSWNEITNCVEPADESGGLRNISTLQRLDLSHNLIESMHSIDCINPASLRHMNIAFNKFGCVTSFDDLIRYKALRYLRMEGNTLIHELPEIVKNVMHLLPQLDYINGSKLTKSERLVAYSMWNSDPIIHEMKKYCYDLLYSNVEPPRYGLETPKHLDYEVPIVILVGPNGTRKHLLAKHIATKYPYYVKIPLIHTTLYQWTNEDNISEEFKAMELLQVSETEFNQMWNKGKFLFVHSDLGDLYGLSRDELDDDGRLVVIPLNIGPALSLSWQGLNTTLILTRPIDDLDYSTLLQKYVASKVWIHNERDALKDVVEEEDKANESVDEEEEDENEIEDEEEQFENDLPLGGPLKGPISFKDFSNRKLSRSNTETKVVISETAVNPTPPAPKNDDELLPNRLPFKSEDSENPFKSPSVDVSIDMDYTFQREYPPWCEEESEEEEPQVTIELPKHVPFIDTMKASQAEKESLWALHDMYYDEKKTYYDEISEHLFTQTVIVDDLNIATKKILPLLMEKYNSSLKPVKVKKQRDALYDVLVKPRVDEMMEILADRGCEGRYETMGAEKDTTDVSSSEETKETLSVPFFSKSTSSLDVTPSTSLTEYGTEERRFEEPEHTWAPQPPPTPTSTRSSVLEVKAKTSMAAAGYEFDAPEKAIKYSKKS